MRRMPRPLSEVVQRLKELETLWLTLGRISEQSFVQLLSNMLDQPPHIVSLLFKKIDADGDETITWNEFIAYHFRVYFILRICSFFGSSMTVFRWRQSASHSNQWENALNRNYLAEGNRSMGRRAHRRCMIDSLCCVPDRIIGLWYIFSYFVSPLREDVINRNYCYDAAETTVFAYTPLIV